MEKGTFNFVVPENKILNLDEGEIIVKPYLDMNLQAALINQYTTTFFSSDNKTIAMDEWDEWGAECALKLAIIDLCSSVPVDGDFENILLSGIYDRIEREIKNYQEFRWLLDNTISNIKEQIAQKKSIGGTLDSLFEKARILVDNLIKSTENLTPEQLKKLKETGQELVDKLAENPLVAEVFKDVAKQSQ